MATETAQLAATREIFHVGAILVYKWGYEQTNAQFFEVVRRSKSGATVWLREIGSELTECGHMSGYRVARPGDFIGPVFRKRVQTWGVRMDHGAAYPNGPGQKHWCSWYA